MNVNQIFARRDNPICLHVSDQIFGASIQSVDTTRNTAAGSISSFDTAVAATQELDSTIGVFRRVHNTCQRFYGGLRLIRAFRTEGVNSVSRSRQTWHSLTRSPKGTEEEHGTAGWKLKNSMVRKVTVHVRIFFAPSAVRHQAQSRSGQVR